jgi:hypothetical protein
VTVKKYSTAGSAQIAVVTVKNGTSTLQWLLNDNIPLQGAAQTQLQ